MTVAADVGEIGRGLRVRDRGWTTLCEELTPRELELLAYLPTRLANVEIAERVYLSLNTVKYHLKNIYRKLEVDSRDWAVARAIELGLLDATVDRCSCGGGWIIAPDSIAASAGQEGGWR